MTTPTSAYDPSARGPYPVGVRSFTAARPDREIEVEVWYPASAEHTGADLDPDVQDRYSMMVGAPAAGQAAVRDAALGVPDGDLAPAVVFSHGFGGHRRQSTHLTTHLASHGYVVAAPDHQGNTTGDVMGWALGVDPPTDMAAYTDETATNRVADARRTLDGLLDGEFAVPGDPHACGVAGHSFGGWTALQTTATDRRIRAVLGLAPAGGDGGVFGGPADPRATMHARLDLDWGRDVPALVIVADDDHVLPLAMMDDLLAHAPAVDRLVTLVNADHYHFCDNTEVVHDLMSGLLGEAGRPSSELMPGAHAHAVTTQLGLALFDSALRDHDAARALLAGDLVDDFAQQGVAVHLTP